MNNIQVVIADDDTSLLRLLEKRLTDAGYTVSAYDNGSDAFESVVRAKPVILLADWEMPGLTGVEICRKLGDAGVADSVYTILLTANSEADQIAAGLEAGAADYLVKPARPAELLARISVGERTLRLLVQQQESEQRLRTVVEASKDAMITIDENGLVTLFNPAAESMFGRSAGEMIGQTLDCLMPPEYRALHDEHVKHYFTQGKPCRRIDRTVELPAVRRNGQRFFVELSLSAGTCGGERIVLAVIRDITERQRAEESQRRLMQAVDAVAEAIMLTDLEGRVLRVNPAFTRITGYTTEEAVGQTPRVLKSGRQSVEFYERMWGTIQDGEVWSGRLINKRKEGTSYVAELTIAPILDEEGTVTGYVGVQRDVSQQVERERELSAAKADAEEALAKLQQVHAQLLQADKMASIGHLAAGVAHEINNPIGFITSNLNSLSRYVADLERVLEAHDELLRECQRGAAVPPDKVDEVARVRKETDIEYVISDVGDLIAESADGAKRVRQIVADLRDFSHVDSPDVTEEDISALLDKTITVAWNELKYKAEVVREYGEIPPIPCYGGKLGQVFLNLLVNAAQAIEERGTITIRTGQQNERIWVEIADTGRGIPPENLGRIFDPFFTTKEVGKGTGLGLHLSHTIMQAHGGKIKAESNVGEGTTIRLELPLSGPPETQESDSESSD